MKFSAAFLARVVAGSSVESRELAPIIRKCAVAGAGKSNAMPHVDDVEQELWVFLMKNVDRLDDDYNIEPYLIKTAYNISLSYNRKFALLGTEGDELPREGGLSGLNGDAVDSPEEAMDAMAEEAAQAQAIAYLMQKSARLRQAVATADTYTDTAEDDDVKRGPLEKPKKELSPDQLELRNIRVQMGLSQGEMAQLLGLKLPTFQAYEYGKTLGVNAEVMERARTLLKESDTSYLHDMFMGRTMQNIVRDWSTRLGVPPGNISELARMMGVDKSTISRWYKSDKVITSNEWELMRYESAVARAETILKRQKRNLSKLN